MWLLKQEVAEAMRELRAAGIDCSEQQRIDFAARCEQETALHSAPRNLKVAGDIAEIRVEGILTEKPDIFAWFFGGGNTTYESIRQAVALADADPMVKKVVFFVNSPGGEVQGLFDTLGAIEASRKPSSVTASFACSAAYAIAATAGKITATNAAVEFGSIGVAARFFHLEEIIDITSTEAPNKRPDPSTPEGQAIIREHLDALHEVFADAIARGRGTTVKTVNETFGRGGIVLSADARRRGMIDKVAKTGLVALSATQPSGDDVEDASANDDAVTAIVGELAAVGLVEDRTTTEDPPNSGAAPEQNAASAAQKGKKPMTEDELKAAHPELYKSVRASAAEEAVKTERDRVDAHLTAGESSGDMKTSLAAVRDGSEMTQTLMVKHVMAGKNNAAVAGRQTETNAAGEAVDTAAPTTQTDEDFGDQVVKVLEARRGVSANG